MSENPFRKKKKYGQNFLINKAVVDRIAAESGVTPDCGVLEIGPGDGALTAALLGKAGKVVSVEIDDELIPVLEARFGADTRFSLVHADILDVDISALIESRFGDMPVCVCANLPYYITTPIIMKLLEGRYGFRSVTVMVQKEVAARLCSTDPAQCGAVTLAVNYYAAAKRLFTVSAGSFSPPPKVDSAVIKLTPYDSPPVDVCDEKLFFDIIRAAFGQRRKTLANALSSAFGFENRQAIAEAIAAAGTDPNTRGERLSIEEFAEITKKINNINL